MSTQAEVQQQAMQRAREFANRRGHRGGGYALEDYQKSLSELSPEERAIERGLAPADGDSQAEPSQRERVSKHFQQEVKKFTTQGHTHGRAIELAKAEEGGLKQVRAGLPTGSPWAAQAEQEQQDEIHRFSKLTGQRPGEVVLKTHAARSGPLSTIENEQLRTARGTLVKQVAADCLHRGRSQPDHLSRKFVDSWFGVNRPPPAPVAGSDNTQALDAYNQTREAFLDEVMEAAREILRNPEAANLLRPTPLGR